MGVRLTLKILQEYVPLDIKEVSSGTKVFDWAVPREWNIEDAYIIDPDGKKIVDFKQSNLHVLGYSIPINEKMQLSELKKHLYTLPDMPEVIPYLTSYYNENWGFCLPHRQYECLKEGTYHVVIDSSLKNGHLVYGECYIKGRSEEEFLLTCYLCHPSLCNDNLSGVAMLAVLAKLMTKMELEYSYRFLFIPETIGAITWLSINTNRLNLIRHGLVATCLGDQGISTYKRTRKGNATIDRVVEKVLKDTGMPYKVINFFPSGSDERQFCSPGINLPVGSLMRTMYGQFPEYHTSADNPEFVIATCLGDTIGKYLRTIYIVENDRTYINQNPMCEPQLGKRGIYSIIGGQKQNNLNELAIFWVLNLADGNNSLLDMSIRSEISFEQIKNAADVLTDYGLIS
jgi:aminopeptidase-like protein